MIQHQNVCPRTKVNVIKANAHKYAVSAMCRVLQIPRSTYYYEAKSKQDKSELTANIIDIIFLDHRIFVSNPFAKALNTLAVQKSRLL